MELLNDELKSVLAKIGYVGLEIEGGVEFDGRNLGPVAEITPKDLRIIIDAVHRGKQLLQNSAQRITIHEFAAHIPNPDDAYKFMAALTLLKNKFGTRIYYVAPFGNFMSLHYQGLIQNAFVPEPVKEEKPKAEKPVTAVGGKTATAPVGSKIEKEQAKEVVKEIVTKVAEIAKPDKPKTPRKSAKPETKGKGGRTSSKKK